MSKYVNAATRNSLANIFSAAVIFGTAIPAAQAAQPAAAVASPIIALPLNPVVPAEQRSCRDKTSSGLGYTVLRPATGAKPGQTDAVMIKYIGYLAATGSVFDQNVGTPLLVENVVPGFSEGLKMMPKGSIYRLCLPAALGYGATASGPIPANSDLVFQVELLDSKTMAEIQAMRSAQEAEAAKQAAAAEKPPAGQPSAKP